MSFLKNALREGLRKGLGDAIGKAVQQAVEPVATRLANEAAESINQATESLDQTAEQSRQSIWQAAGLEGALGNLQRSMENYATEAAKNMKICPECEAPCSADKQFCPSCGARLPETTVAQGAVCPACCKQNTVGTKFCTACGAKLPAALQEEQAEATEAAAILSRWDTCLAAYPKWSCGGRPANLEMLDSNQYIFAVDFKGDPQAARQAVQDYLALARQHGFRPAGMYPSNDNLYNKIDGVCYYLDTEHAFDGDTDCPTIGFAVQEPAGGFEYVKPEPKKKVSLLDLFK